MSYDYDALYAKTPDALGPPTASIVDFFQQYDRPTARVLDIGCGQGRDALFIARLGHHVTGVDLSPHGIAALAAAASAEALPIDGIVADMTSFKPSGLFDVILIDRTLHMLPTDARLAALARLIHHLAPQGWLVIADEAPNMAGFQAILDADATPWISRNQTDGLLIAQRA